LINGRNRFFEGNVAKIKCTNISVLSTIIIAAVKLPKPKTNDEIEEKAN
jgi:hypothetical protein